MNEILNRKEYKAWLKDFKQKVRQAQLKAAVSVNTALLEFYWELGADIIEQQKNASWGSGFLKQLSKDLMAEFPDMKGFSEANLSFIRRWFLFYSNEEDNSVTGCYENSIAKQPVSQLKKAAHQPQAIRKSITACGGICQQSVAQLTKIPWGHNIAIISKCKSKEKALFYAQKTIDHGWSRSVLTHQIESGLYEREGKAVTNFEHTLPKPQSDLALQLLKDPYNFDFLTLTEDHNERELEKGLLEHIIKFLLELGAGFAFVGRQKELKVGNKEFFLDLLFYHTKLHCYVVVELKTGEFEPEFAGKLNFYIKTVDEQIKADNDEPTIGILLCKTHDKLVVEYALSDIHKPMGVSEYQLAHSLPEDLKSSLPSIEEIEAELCKDKNDAS